MLLLQYAFGDGSNGFNAGVAFSWVLCIVALPLAAAVAGGLWITGVKVLAQRLGRAMNALSIASPSWPMAYSAFDEEYFGLAGSLFVALCGYALLLRPRAARVWHLRWNGPNRAI